MELSRRNLPRALTTVFVWSLIACSTAETERLQFTIQTLRERAEHLSSPERSEIARGLIRAERQTGVDALLLLALMEQESHFRRRAKGPRGALGLLQVKPATGRAVAERNRLPWKGEASLFDPSTNLLIGATYLAELRTRFDSWDLALTAYNQGPARARRIARRGRRPSSRYAARILRRTETLRQAAQKTAGDGNVSAN